MDDDLNAKLDRITGEVQSVKSEMQGVKSEMQGVKSEIKSVKSKVDSFGVSGATFLIILVLALISNPKRADHISMIEGRVGHLATVLDGVGSVLQALPNVGPSKSIKDNYKFTYDSYWIFSRTTLTIDGKKRQLTFGIFGNVFDERFLDELKNVLEKPPVQQEPLSRFNACLNRPNRGEADCRK